MVAETATTTTPSSMSVEITDDDIERMGKALGVMRTRHTEPKSFFGSLLMIALALDTIPGDTRIGQKVMLAAEAQDEAVCAAHGADTSASVTETGARPILAAPFTEQELACIQDGIVVLCSIFYALPTEAWGRGLYPPGFVVEDEEWVKTTHAKMDAWMESKGIDESVVEITNFPTATGVIAAMLKTEADAMLGRKGAVH